MAHIKIYNMATVTCMRLIHTRYDVTVPTLLKLYPITRHYFPIKTYLSQSRVIRGIQFPYLIVTSHLRSSTLFFFHFSFSTAIVAILLLYYKITLVIATIARQHLLSLLLILIHSLCPILLPILWYIGGRRVSKSHMLGENHWRFKVQLVTS